MADITAADWDRCAGSHDPFLSHRFLLALEESGAAAEKTGWTPHHFVLEDAAGAVAAVAPAYWKSHSFGEYVFDHGWAEAFERAGGRYYPKLQVAVPFTPVPGRRLLARDGPDHGAATRALSAACIAELRSHEASSAHVTFCTEEEWRRLGDEGFLLRTGEQFHWTNGGYDTFDDFLGTLAARKRKAVRKERRDALQDGAIEVRAVDGTEATEADWDAMFAFYMDTGRRKWGSPYLNRAFFRLLAGRMADMVLLVLAFRDGRRIAGALSLKGSGVLYGRYWGCAEYHPALHFEVCYYKSIEYAIGNGLKRVEAGAQGPHKLARGYLPVRTHSAHWIADRGFRGAVEEYLARERRSVDDDIAALARHSPFRRAP